MKGTGRLRRAASSSGSAAPAARSGGTPRLAAITMVRDEADLLPLWLRHYAEQCGGPENLYVIDDGSSDGSTDALDCSVIRLPPLGGAHFERSRMTMVSGLAAGLLSRYDAVLFADADEFLVADPGSFGGLRDLVAARADRDVIGAMTLNVVHDVRREPALDLGAPILAQRRWAKFVPLMCKPAIHRRPVPWQAASHGTSVPYDPDPDLYLFHLKFADEALLRAAGDRRKVLADTEGRAAATSWQFAGDDLADLLREVTDIDPESVPPFKPAKRELRKIVARTDDGVYRAHGARQVPAMRKQPMVSIPARFAASL